VRDETSAPTVSIVIPVWNKLPFTRQCLDRIWRNTGAAVTWEVIVVDNGSSDGTREHFEGGGALPGPVVYHRNPTNLGFARGNNIGARLARGRYLLFLNNDTLVQPGWLEEMVRLAERDPAVGVVGIKQLFPYTGTIHHTGIVFTAGGIPQHLYPHADARLPHVNKQREYQAVTGACLLIPKDLFERCGQFDDGYLNGYEDVDLCLAVRRAGRKVVCCTSAFIYHYGQITEGRTLDDDANARRFAEKWKGTLRVDEGDYLRQDAADLSRASRGRPARPAADPDALYFLDDLSQGSALAWAVADLVLALKRRGAAVHLKAGPLTKTLPGAVRRELEGLMVPAPSLDGAHVKWSHYWPRHLALDLTGRVNLELFVINYRFAEPGSQPWDAWLQCLRQNHAHKLPVTGFCRDVLLQTGVQAAECDVLWLGYAPEVHQVEATARPARPFRLLTVTNSHDPERYGTRLLLEAYWQAFGPGDPVALVVKDYGTGAADTSIRDLIRAGAGRARVEYLTDFTSKRDLIRLYRSCDAFASAHRAEGFGMKILDALACGLPVVTPLFGGPADFCTASNSFPVAFRPAPVGDCLDTRGFRLTNAPTWCEPDRDDLARQLRRVVEDPEAARAVGARGRADVVERFSWDASAARLVEIVGRLRAERQAARPRPLAPAAATPAERSPYWLGCRVSVVVPTHNRKAILLECLRALGRQSVLPSEFEVLVVDDGSTDGTEAAVAAESFPFPLRYHRQANQGPGPARNWGIAHAQGELVLMIGDDIIAGERLLEHHLLAHARRPEPGAAVLGHTDWAPWLSVTPVMAYVCGEGTQQFAYDYIPRLPRLDYRFFYTSNISLKRRFLQDALEAGIGFDPCFRHAAYEDSEFAYRLEPRGLAIHYCAEARAVHDHWMDLESFCRREHRVGQMAVVFYRKHPGLDPVLQVSWIAEWTDAVERLLAQPALLKQVAALDAQTDQLLRGLERSLEELLALELGPSADLRPALHRLLALLFDVERTRGKVEEWYATVEDPAKVDAARCLLGCMKKLAYLGAHAGQLAQLGPKMPGLDPGLLGTLDAEAGNLERRLGARLPERRPAPRGVRAGARGLLRRVVLGGPAFRLLRSADLYLTGRVGDPDAPRWVTQYPRVRERIKRLLF
jgi:GT2 family glycosyltransferase/glycosyltransferase involved in cell wall biosynthesis